MWIRTDTIEIWPVPEVSFTVSPADHVVMLPNQAIHCYNKSTYGDEYVWNFGDSDTSHAENPIHYYTAEGLYNITLTVYTENGCFGSWTDPNPIVVEPPGVCLFPNAFTPNRTDGANNVLENDVFQPVHRGIGEYKLEIFNRWGQKIFESIDPDMGWDGRVNGKLAPQDVYVWKVTGKYKNGVNFILAGDVTFMNTL